MNSSIFKTALFGALLLLGGQVQALTLVPTDAAFSGSVPNNPDASDVETITSSPAGSLTELYKDNAGGVEEGEANFMASYETSYDDESDPMNAYISYVGGDIMTDAQWLLVKDGNQDPIWYIFDLSESGFNWNGTDTIELLGFWPNQGAISHVSIFGGTSSVPAPGAAFLLGLGLIGLVGMRKKIS